MARLAFAAVVGVAVGYFSGNPALGLQAFTLAYGVSAGLDPNQKVIGPRLSDLKAPQATYGAPIAYIEGAPRGAWNVLWASNKREIPTTTSSGKGGPGVDSTTFSYEMDIFYLVDINGATDLRRVWSNGKLVWSAADDSDGETLAASSVTTAWRDIRFYSGAADQLPDPTYEAAKGVGNVPAYRGRCTIMVEGLNLGQSGQMPVLTFEVLTESNGAYASTNFATFPSDEGVPYISGISAMDPAGYEFIYGIDYDAFNGQFQDFVVYDVSSDGTITTGARYSLPARHGPCAQGNSDETCLIAQEKPGFGGFVTYHTVAFTDGSYIQVGSDGDNKKKTFSKLGSLIASVGVEDADGGDHKVRLYNRSTGAFVRRSASLPKYTQSIALTPDFVYVLSFDGTEIYQLDVATLTLQQTFAPPDDGTSKPAVQSGITSDDDGRLILFDIGWATGLTPHPDSIWAWDGSWLLLADNMTQLYATPTDRHALYAKKGVLAMQRFDSSGIAPFREQFYIALRRVAIVAPTLDQVVRRLCLRTGQLTDDDIDVTDLSHDVAIASGVVRAMPITQATTMRGAIEPLMDAYFFDWSEGETLRAVRRGGDAVVTIPYEDMGAGQDGNTTEPLPMKRLNDPEIAARFSVKFANVLNDFQDGLVQADRLVTESTAEAMNEYVLGFTPTEAAKIADIKTLDAAVQLIQIGPVSVSRKYSYLEPADVVNLVDLYGDTFRARITKATIGGGVIQLELVLDDASVLNSVAATDSSYASSTLVRLLADTVLVPMDIAPLSDAFAGVGYMAAFGATGPWTGAELDRSLDDVTYAKLLDVGDRAVQGKATSTLGDFTGGNVFDEVNTLTVDVGDGTLSSTTRDGMLTTNDNPLAVGSNDNGWEVVQFRTASLLSPGVYLLSGFLRGRRGTEWAIGGHVSGEKVVLLQTTGLRHIVDVAADIGVPYHLKAVTHGKSRADAPSQLFTDTGVSLKPFAPVDLRASTTGSAVVISWHRRSRLSSRFLALVDPPLGETIEQYDVELRDGSSTLVDSATVTTPSYSASGLVGGDYILPPIWGMQSLSGTRVAIRQDNPVGVVSAAQFSAESILALNSDGTIAEQSATLENIVTGWTFNGSAVYVVGYRLNNTIPATYADSKVQKLTLGTLASIDATNAAGTAGDYFGVAHDGTDVWVSERTSNNLRRLNSTTLVSIASYAVAGSPQAMKYASGKLYVICGSSGELVRFDTSSHTEDYRVSVIASPFDVLVVGSVAFVAGGTQIAAYNASTGALIHAETFTAMIGLPMRAMCVFGSQVAVVGNDIAGGTGAGVLLLNATTGVRENLQAAPVSLLAYAAGAVSADLYLTGSAGPGFSYRTRKYSVAPAHLAGYSISVWQKSSIVGRGYPATLDL